MKIFRVVFNNGECVDMDVSEFGDDAGGDTIDHLAIIHGGVNKIEEVPRDEDSGK